jgi:hypothetical protein
MDESTDEDKTLVANERSPRKRKKRKSRKKKIENVETNDECMTDQYTADTGKKTEKRNKRTLINLFKKSKESNLDKREFAHNDNGNSDIAYSNVDSEEIQISLFSKFDPQLQPRIRLGCMTLKDVMHEKYSAHEQPNSEKCLLNNDASDMSASLTDIGDHVTPTSSLNHKTKTRSSGAVNQQRTQIPCQTSQSNETTNYSLLSNPDEQLSNVSHQNLMHSSRQGERGRQLAKHQRHKRSSSSEFVDSEQKRKSFSAFMDLSQTPHSHKSSLHGKGSSRHGKINGRDRSPAEIDINPTNTLKTDRENINQKDDTNLINETSPNITNWFERTKKQNIDVSKPVSQMDAMDVLIDTNTNSSRRVREEKRLDRKSYKSPRRFSGRSISRERRKSGKSHETAEKTIDIQESDQPDVAKECQKGGNNCKTVIETEIRQHKIPFNKLMSRSIQTSMQCLDIDKDQHESKAECKNENIISVVPLIVEHTINEDSTRQNRKSITSSEQFLDERSISHNSSESEEFKTPKQSPLPERKIVDEIIPVEITAKTTNDTEERVKQKESEKKSPKLSFLAVVALKRKLGRQRKKKKRKMSKDDKNKERNDEKPEVILPEVSDKSEQSDIENEKYLTSFYLENETNFNIGTLSYLPETDIVDVDELNKDLSHKDKKLSFDIISEPDNSMSDTYMHKHRQMAKRRQSEVFREKRAKALTYCKKFVAFLFSHIGLCSLMVAYAILGGFIFRAIEGPFEIETKIKVISERQKTRDQIMQLATSLILNKRSRNNVSKEIDILLSDFQREVYIATDIHGFNNDDSADSVDGQKAEQWSLASSLLFAITVMTTIGKFIFYFRITDFDKFKFKFTAKNAIYIVISSML